MKMFEKATLKRWVLSLGALATGVAVLMTPLTVKANANAALTQIEFIKWLVQLADATSQFSSSSTAADYIQWARDNGVNPSSGWNATALLTREVMAEALVQFFNLNPGKKADYIRVLEREGIVVPDDPVVTRAGFVNVVDDFGFQTLSGKKAKKKKTVLCPPKTPGKPWKLKSKCTPPKTKPKPPKPPKPPTTPKPPKPRK